MLRTDDFGGRVKLRHLKILMAVAHSGSMAKAADSLAISHPVISKAIAELEQTLGLRLFDRTSHGVEPTLYGRALLERSVAMFNDLRTTVNELEHLSDPTAGELRIGSGEATATGMLGVIIDRLLRQCPRLIFELTIAGVVPDLLHRDLRARTIDLIIGRLPSPVPDDMEAITLYNDELFVVAAVKNHLTRRRRVELADLVNEAWCGPSFDTFPWSLYGDAFRANNLEVPRNVVLVRSILAQQSLLATGHFLTIFPRTVLHFHAMTLSLKRVPVDLSVQKFPVGIVTLRNRTLAPVAQLFIDCAREVAKPLGRPGWPSARR